ncbi:MAG: Vancomycin B-type resistance protein VanW [Firmicutes bacterium ADurb.Bin456]|nr:MAG: Vancomycin B-type resistance protein VanW [Firmicutes bacterium ADurb.Bin456]
MAIKTTRLIVSLLLVTAVIVLMFFLTSGFFSTATEKVLPGVEVLDVKLGGLNRLEGTARLMDLEKNLRAKRVTLRFEDRSWQLLLNETGFELDEEAIMDAALSAGRHGSLYKRWMERKRFNKTGLPLLPVIAFDRERLAGRVNELCAGILVQPRDASFSIDRNDLVTVIPGKNGVGVDFDLLEKDLVSVLSSEQPVVTLVTVNQAPERTTAFLESMNVKGLLGGYTTKFDPAKTSRTYNVSVAAQALDKMLILPGHEVSFNKVVGPRSSEAGYKNAPVIVNNEFVDGLGGGVCQVSTTLYNAVLLANLGIVKRSSHSLPVSYVPIGRDATVVYDTVDLTFRNNTDSYLYLKTSVTGGMLTIKIYGNTSYKRDVTVNTWITEEIEPQVIYETDPNLPLGEEVVKQEGSKGFKTAAERVVKKNGVVEKREAIPSSNYSPVNKIIAVGSMEQDLPQIAPSKPAPGTTKPVINVPGVQENLGNPSGQNGDRLPSNADTDDSSKLPTDGNTENSADLTSSLPFPLVVLSRTSTKPSPRAGLDGGEPQSRGGGRQSGEFQQGNRVPSVWIPRTNVL